MSPQNVSSTPPFEVGEEVRCAYNKSNKHDCPNSKCWRAIIGEVSRHDSYESGWRVRVTDELLCPTGKADHDDIGWLDSMWFRRLPSGIGSAASQQRKKAADAKTKR